MPIKLALSTDHAGFELLQQLQQHLQAKGYECVNYGPTSLNPDDDYPDFIAPAAKAVATGECQMGIIMGGSGQGEAMAANRFKGVRAAVYYGPAKALDVSGQTTDDEYQILRLSRQHNNANILSLAARFLTPEQVIAATELWISTPFSGQERHARRIAKLDQEA